MATVTLETPSEAVVNAANSIVTVTDSRGRQIGVKKLTAFGRMQMFRIVGKDDSQNQAFMNYAVAAFSVASVDGEAQRITNLAHMEALVQRLDEDGLAAVIGAMAELYGDEGDAEDTLKNSSGTPTSA